MERKHRYRREEPVLPIIKHVLMKHALLHLFTPAVMMVSLMLLVKCT